MNKNVLLHVIFLLSVIAAYFISPLFLKDRHGNQPLKDPLAETSSKTLTAAVTDATTVETTPAPVVHTPQLVQYIEILKGCGANFVGNCVNVRAGPGTDYDVVTQLRAGVILRVAGSVEAEGRTWYKVTFKEWLRYADRLDSDWYVAADYTRPFFDEGLKELGPGEYGSTTKKIIVDLSEQKIYAYDGDTLFMEQLVSTGVPATPTPRGVFSIFKKTPSRYMQGPIPGISTTYYDLPGVPWNLYFTSDGAVFHGAYWHNDFGHVHSNGCVNLPIEKAEKLYAWADLGTKVIVRD